MLADDPREHDLRPVPSLPQRCSLKTDHTVWCRGRSDDRGIEGDLPEDGSATRVVFPFGGFPSLLPELQREDLAAFVETLAPLSSGERSLAAMPFALVVR